MCLWFGFRSSSRMAWCVVLCAIAGLLPSCASDGNFCLFGYTTKPNYDTSIHTVRVPIFKNVTFYRGLEFELTQAIVREIEAKTPYKVVGEGCAADTELSGPARAAARADRGRDAPPPLPPDLPPGAPLPKPPVTLVTSLGHFVPEIGQSITTAHQENVDRLAIQIVSMMEKPW